MLGRLFCKNYLFLWMNFLNPTPNIRSLKKTAQGKVAKTHFPGNKTKNPIKSASSWHCFLTLSNEVLQKAWGVSGPTRIPLVHHRAPSPRPCNPVWLCPEAFSSCGWERLRYQRAEIWVTLGTLSFNKQPQRAFQIQASTVWKTRKLEPSRGRGGREASPASPNPPKVTLQTRGS